MYEGDRSQHWGDSPTLFEKCVSFLKSFMLGWETRSMGQCPHPRMEGSSGKFQCQDQIPSRESNQAALVRGWHAVLFWPHAILGVYLIYHTNYSRFETLVRRKRKSWTIKWLGLDKFSNIAKIKCHEISPFQNCEIKLSWNFPTIIKVCTCFLNIWCNQFVIHRFYSNRLLPFWMEFPVTGFLLRNFWIHVTLHLWHQH